MAHSGSPIRNGFTLVEMLVALFVFGLISAAGVTMLRTTADSQIQLRDKLGERATLSRLSNLIEADLAQAVPRPARIEGGSSRPAFESGDGQLFTFSRIGAAPDAVSAQPTLARIAYRFDGGKLVRSASTHADGARGGNDAVLIDGLRQATIRLREANGGWRDDWTAVEAAILPRALELVLTTKDGRDYRMLYLVGANSGPAKIQGEDAENGEAI
ncbi:type II secretion system protein GspJ [Sphingorhabdus pulchriflava]|uniref:Type II secretion system protein J n=1 Tax=Sphingorhabdus pulchriflava TaxID=2292257 RepID=A0A371BFF0_9SPHN|nr:type II secretion system minor pseudopilin GspJ [Sphingorhabdus pulchriflava]RDV06336.1 type II secretion system protein GspJ [Sphingorhabdus pulchriflava]